MENIRIERLGTTTLCIRADNKPVGFVSLLHFKETLQGEIVGLYVDPDHRGKGIGRQLIEAIVEAARKEGLREIKATTTLDNIKSANLFTALGFTACKHYSLVLDEAEIIKADKVFGAKKFVDHAIKIPDIKQRKAKLI